MQKNEIIGTKINGEPGDNKNLYMVNWFHCANHGLYMLWAKDEEEARSNCIYGDHVTFVVTKIDPSDMPVVFKGDSMLKDLGVE